MPVVKVSSQTGFFLDIYLNTFFGVLNFGNISAMRLFFLWRAFKISCRFQKWKKKIRKMFLVSEIIASEIAAVNCLYYDRNTCDGQSMPIETVLRVSI